MNVISKLTVLACAAVALSACAGHQNVKGSGTSTPPAASSVPEATTPPPATEQQPQGAETAPVQSEQGFQGNPLDDPNSPLHQRVVYFDLDQDTVKPDFQAAMACHAKYLRDRPDSRMTLEGNADERGSREYNLGLGERRGNAVSSALQANGGSASQITVVSYGEERPVCNESNEGCWSQNRRVEIVYTAK